MNLTEYIRPRILAPPKGAPELPLPSLDDPRVVRALEEYSAALKAGQRPDRHEFQARYPEVAAALADCLEALEFVQAAAPLLQPDAGGQAAAASAAALEDYPGGPLGDYRIVREIGRGGMGVVYEAVQISLVRRVALKVLPFAATLDAKQLQRFKNESLAAAHLHHQNIVPVYGVGCERGVHYYAMQFIDGQTLAAMIADLRRLAGLDPEDRAGTTAAAGTLAAELASGRWQPPQQGRACSQATSSHTPLLSGPEPVGTPRRVDATAAPTATAPLPTDRSTVTSPAYFRTAANLGVQAALALEHAHQLGVVHRDIKPANLLLDGRGNLWITDFGLAHCQSQAGLTMTGDLVGTLRYMSPEQALAQRVVIDHRTDIYSLGATLYELLTLEPLFDGRDRQELLRQIAFLEPKPPRRLNKRVPAELETIVLKSLEKAPADRYATAQALADDLGRFLKDESILAKRPSPLQRARKCAQRHPGVVRTALLALALLLLTISVGASLAAWRLNKEQNATRAQLRLTEQAQARSMHRLYDARLAEAIAGSRSRRVGQRFDSLGAVAQALKIARDLNLAAERLLELRNAAIACLALPDLRIAKKWNSWPDTWSVNFDSTLERYARVDRQGVVHIHRGADDAEICRFPGIGPGEAWAWFSPDGQFLGLHNLGRRVKVWKLAGPEPVVVAEELSAPGGAAFSPDSRRLATGHADGSIRVYELPSGRRLKQLEGVPRHGGMVFHPEGRQLAVSCATGIQVYDLETGRILADLRQPAKTSGFAWHPDGKTLAAACDDSRIYLWDVASGKQTHVLEGCRGTGITISFNHAGDLLASGGWDGVLRLWDPRMGQQLFNTPASTSAGFSLDDRLLAHDIRDGKLGLWEIAAGGEYRTLVRAAAAGRGYYQYPTIRSDGRLLAVGMGEGVGLWDPHSGKELAYIESPGTNFVLFEPSGALLTNGSAGLLRWPVQADAASPGLLRLGTPHRLSVPGPICHVASSGDGRVIAVSQFQGGRVLHADRPDQPVPIGPHDDARYIAVSHDGRWVATGSHTGTGVKIWDSRGGELVKEILVDSGSRVGFSPEGKSLVTTGGGLRLWAVGSWREGPQIGGGAAFAFSPDGTLLAVETGRGAVRLVDPDTGWEFARLENPNQDRAFYLSFGADGTQLVSTEGGNHSFHVWDLRAIRKQLATMGLDWALPPYPPTLEVNETQPLQIQVEIGDEAQLLREREAATREVIAQQRRALAANPNNALACNNLAWTYLTALAGLRDWKAALPLAQKAVQLEPGAMYRNTLGLAYYRAGRYREAIEAFQANLKDQVDWALAYDLYFLAMSHHQLGESAQARQFYYLAGRWSDAHREALNPDLAELAAIQTEAAELLGVIEKK